MSRIELSLENMTMPCARARLMLRLATRRVGRHDAKLAETAATRVRPPSPRFSAIRSFATSSASSGCNPKATEFSAASRYERRRPKTSRFGCVIARSRQVRGGAAIQPARRAPFRLRRLHRRLHRRHRDAPVSARRLARFGMRVASGGERRFSLSNECKTSKV